MKLKLGLIGKIFSPKNIFHYDNALVMGSFFLIFGLLLTGLSLEVFDPVSDAFSDVEFTDINYSYLGKNDDLRGVSKETGESIIDTNIILINIGDLKRPGIANLINTVSQYSPNVIGIDARFSKHKDSTSDKLLATAIKNAKNVVLAAQGVGKIDDKDAYDSIIAPIPELRKHSEYGIANMSLAETGNDLERYKICREFVAGSFINDTTYDPCFDARIANRYAPEKAKKLIDRQHFEEIINYSGNIFIEFAQNLSFPRFLARDYTEIFSEDFTNPDGLKKLLKGKIVLLGYLGDHIHAVNDDEDKFFTPLNKKYIGKAELDMYGVVIHANIISMILNERYIDTMPTIWTHIFGILITYLTFAAFRPVYNDYKIWYDGGTKVMSFIIVLFLLYGIGKIFADYDYKIHIPGMYMGAILLAGDYMEIYYGLFENLVRKFRKKL